MHWPLPELQQHLNQGSQSCACTPHALQVVVAKGDGSYHWEELAGDANRTVDVGAGALSVTCHMGGGTEVSSSVGSGSGDERPSAIDMSVDMDAAQELNPAFGTQVPF
jgi:hypothetical protein